MKLYQLLFLFGSFSASLALAQAPPSTLTAPAVANDITTLTSKHFPANVDMIAGGIAAEKNAQHVGRLLAEKATACYTCFGATCNTPPPPPVTPPNPPPAAGPTCTASGNTYASCGECAALGFHAVYALSLSRQYHEAVPRAVQGANATSKVDNTPDSSLYDVDKYVMDNETATKNAILALKGVSTAVVLDFTNVVFKGPAGVVLSAGNLNATTGGFSNLYLRTAELNALKAKVQDSALAANAVFPIPTPNPKYASPETSSQASNSLVSSSTSSAASSSAAAMKTATVMFNGEPIGCANCQSNFEAISGRLQKVLSP